MVVLIVIVIKDERNRILKFLGMNIYEIIIGCCNRINIMYFIKWVFSDIEENL